MTRKKTRSLSNYNRQLLAIHDEYVEETGDRNPDNYNVAIWAYKNGKFEPRPRDIYRQMARELSHACSQDFLADENGEPVRRRHAYKEKRGDEQLTFWFKIEEGTPDQMRNSAAARRRGTLMDVLQLSRDVSYYNLHYNPGDPLEIDVNFTPDVEERSLPTEYPEAPPEEDQTE